MQEYITVLYEDDHLLVINKPAGLLSQASGAPSQIETNAEKEVSLLLGIPVWAAHRLDKATSGLLLLSKRKEGLSALQGLFQSRSIKKVYRAVVVGTLPSLKGSLETPLSVPHEPGKLHAARTDYAVLSSGTFQFPHQRPQALTIHHVEVALHTGRKHQIRRHFGGIDCPILGDLHYGKDNFNRLAIRNWGLGHLWLLSYQMEFEHPLVDREISVTAPMPATWRGILDQM